MLNERIVRERQRQVRESLDKLEQERATLEDMLRADERWLQLHGVTEEPAQLPLSTNGHATISTTERRKPTFGASIGTISQKAAIIAVLKGANGRGMHSKEIWEAALRLGAESKAAKPLASVDWAIKSLIDEGSPIVKTAERTYAWIPKKEAQAVSA